MKITKEELKNGLVREIDRATLALSVLKQCVCQLAQDEPDKNISIEKMAVPLFDDVKAQNMVIQFESFKDIPGFVDYLFKDKNIEEFNGESDRTPEPEDDDFIIKMLKDLGIIDKDAEVEVIAVRSKGCK